MPNANLRFKRADGSEYPDFTTGTLAEVASYVKDKSTGQRSSFVGTNNMKKDCAGVTFDDAIDSIKGTSFALGDILVSNIRPYLKKSWLSDRDGICSTDVLCIRPNSNVCARYLYTLLSTDRFFGYVMSSAKGSKMPRGDKASIINMPIHLPCLEEQQKIADFFSNLDDVIALSVAEVAALEQEKRIAVQKIFSQKTRFRQSNGSTYPDWQSLHLGDIGEVAMCKRVFKKETSSTGDVPFFKISTFGGIPDAYISFELFERYRNQYRFPHVGSVLISAAGTIGKVVLYKGQNAYYQDSNIVWLEHGDEALDDFLFQFYQQVSWSNLEGGTIKRLYNDIILNTPISLPCLEEQQKIADFLSAFDEAIDLAKKELEQWKLLKKGLMQQMFV